VGEFVIIKLDEKYRPIVSAYVRYFWGGPMMVTLGNEYDTSDLPGFVAVDEGALLGAVLYRMHNGECEIAGLFSLIRNKGIGTELMKAVTDIAIHEHCARLWLITTNDNTNGIRFYQKRGFSLKAVHIGSIEAMRKLKSELATLGDDEIPIEHEFEFEYILPGFNG
jgi:GNAT superfamily N-acetyltransferase